jgi:hypothetical protein
VNQPTDFRDLIKALNARSVEFVIIGAFALAYHGRPRATGDLDVWIRPTSENAKRLLQALADFGIASIGLTESDVLSGKVVQLGDPPVRVDLLTDLDGLTPEQTWSQRVQGHFADQPAPYLSKETLILNKRATGRPQDIADIDALTK